MELRLYNNTNTYSFQVEDLNYGEKLFYNIQVPLNEVVDGKYNLALEENGNILVEDIIVVGDFDSNSLQYSKGENVYIENITDVKLEDMVTTSITSTDVVIYPSEEYDGMKAVTVNAETLYISGKRDGIDEQISKLESITITENGTYERGDGYNHIVVDVPDLNGSYDDGYNNGYNEGMSNGYNDGYNKGVEDTTISAGEIIAETATILDITENGVYTTKYTGGDGNLIKQVNVNVTPKINVAEYRLKFRNSTFETIPNNLDFSEVVDMSYMFADCVSLKTVSLDCFNVKNMDSMFNSAMNLVSLELSNTHNVTDMSSMFWWCGNIKVINELNTVNVKKMQFMFAAADRIESLPEFDCSSLNNISTYFGFGGGGSLRNCGGWKNLKIDWNDDDGLNCCPNLTYESCINILNGLADVTELGERTLKVHSNFLTLVGDNISIATAKNWVITA